MDPITTAIVAALASGLATGIGKVSETIVPDAYNALKQLLKKKFGEKSELVEAVNKLEQEPDFNPNKETLAGRVAQKEADKDPEVLQAAQKLLDVVEKRSLAIGATGVNLEEVRAASLRITDIIASGTGVNVRQGKFGDVTISGVRAGGQSDPNV